MTFLRIERLTERGNMGSCTLAQVEAFSRRSGNIDTRQAQAIEDNLVG